jgi:hypothetical protein
MYTNPRGAIAFLAPSRSPVEQTLYEALRAATCGDNSSRVVGLGPAASPHSKGLRSPADATPEALCVCYHTDGRGRAAYHVSLIFNGPRDRHGPGPDAVPFDAAPD